MSIDFLVRPCQNLEEAKASQKLDDRVWQNGFQHYEWLFAHDPDLLLVAVEKVSNRFLGYVGVEKFDSGDLSVGVGSNYDRSMPPWNHDPGEWHKDEGEVYHIAGAAVIPEVEKEGVFGKLIRQLITQTENNESILTVATTYNLRHPTVKDPLKLWGQFGFKPVPKTYDPNWNHDGNNHPKNIPNDGSIIWTYRGLGPF
jgi:hypothetical protein